MAYKEGHDFEKQLDKVIDYINKSGYHAHKNHPRRNFEGTYLAGEPFDYEVFIPGHHEVFDAKTSKASAWEMKSKDIVQAENLKHCQKAGLKAYFLIKFEKEGVKQIDIDVVQNLLKLGNKAIPATMGIDWELINTIKKGVGTK